MIPIIEVYGDIVYAMDGDAWRGTSTTTSLFVTSTEVVLDKHLLNRSVAKMYSIS